MDKHPQASRLEGPRSLLNIYEKQEEREDRMKKEREEKLKAQKRKIKEKRIAHYVILSYQWGKYQRKGFLFQRIMYRRWPLASCHVNPPMINTLIGEGYLKRPTLYACFAKC